MTVVVMTVQFSLHLYATVYLLLLQSVESHTQQVLPNATILEQYRLV
jgi:hypothetical protein